MGLLQVAVVECGRGWFYDCLCWWLAYYVMIVCVSGAFGWVFWVFGFVWWFG